MIQNIIKGMIIGFASVLPGISGGTLAISMGIYDKLIYCINHVFTEFRKTIVFMFPIAVGVGIAFVSSVFGLEYLYEKYPVPINILFCILMLSGVPNIYKNVKNSVVRKSHILCAFCMFAFTLTIPMLNGREGDAVHLSISVWGFAVLLLIGILSSATLIIPGISGSVLLMLLGYYYPLLNLIKSTIIAFMKWESAVLLQNILYLFPFGVGIIIGIFVVARLIEWLFSQYAECTCWGILGLLIASPIALFFV